MNRRKDDPESCRAEILKEFREIVDEFPLSKNKFREIVVVTNDSKGDFAECIWKAQNP